MEPLVTSTGPHPYRVSIWVCHDSAVDPGRGDDDENDDEVVVGNSMMLLKMKIVMLLLKILLLQWGRRISTT